MMTRCIRPRAGEFRQRIHHSAHARQLTKRRTLAQAGAVIAVSHAIADDLKRRAPELATTPLYTIPNPVDMSHLDEIYANVAAPLPGPYVLYAGTLATNKGVQFLLRAYERAHLHWPLVVVGEGPLRAALEAEARARQIDVRLLGWLSRTETLSWMRHATMLAFPSYGPESLSRVLLEAAALGVPIAAMETGGTRDILHQRRPRRCCRGGCRRVRERPRSPRRRPRPARRARPRGTPRRARAVQRPIGRRADRTGLSLAPVAAGGVMGRRAPLRVAVVTRAVMPLHGVGGLERSVYDLVRHLAAEAWTSRWSRYLRRGTKAIDRPVRVGSHRRASRPLSHVPVRNCRGTTILDRARRIRFGWRAAGCARRRAGRRVDLVHGFGASVLATRWRAVERARRSGSIRKAWRNSARRPGQPSASVSVRPSGAPSRVQQAGGRDDRD
jgi:glycosyltransferase involved in cell wall biosynthesis